MVMSCRIFVLFAAICCVFAHEGAEDTVNYTTDDFKSEVPKKNHFIMFYAPWCDHCKRLFPVWGQLTKKFADAENLDVSIALVDCTVETALCSENDVTGYPTLKFFKVGENEGVKFRGTRDISSLSSYVLEQLGKKPTAGDSSPSSDAEKLYDLSEDNFHAHVATGKHFVKFFAPWCGHCQKLAPTWEELARSSLPHDVTVAKVDCTLHRGVCNEFEVKGYPTMLWIEEGKKTEKYQGSRTLEDLLEFVSRMASSAQDDNAATTGEPNVEGELSVVILTGDTFPQVTATGFTFVKFFAPWCGHCKRLAPIWDELSLKLLDKEGVRVAKVDCTLEENKKLCNTQEVDGFPTIFLYQDGAKISEYTGSRSLEDMHQFVTKHMTATEKDEL